RRYARPRGAAERRRRPDELEAAAGPLGRDRSGLPRPARHRPAAAAADPEPDADPDAEAEGPAYRGAAGDLHLAAPSRPDRLALPRRLRDARAERSAASAIVASPAAKPSRSRCARSAFAFAARDPPSRSRCGRAARAFLLCALKGRPRGSTMGK